MKFNVYASSDRDVVVAWEHRDEARGVIGRLTAKPISIGICETLSDATRVAKEHLADRPLDEVYIANDADELYERLVSQQYVAENGMPRSFGCMVSALLILLCVTLAGSKFLGLGFGGLVIFGCVGLFYVLIVCVRIQNELEGLVACLIILLMIFCMMPFVRAARDRAKKAKQETSRLSGSAIEEKFWQGENMLSVLKFDQKTSS